MTTRRKQYRVQPLGVRLAPEGPAIVVPYPSVDRTDRAAAVFERVLGGKPHEEMWVLAVSAEYEVLGLCRVGQGGGLAVAMTAAEVFRPVIACGAQAFLLAHNHPCLPCRPSPEDWELTALLVDLGEKLGLPLRDHLVLGRDGYTSCREKRGRLFS